MKYKVKGKLVKIFLGNLFIICLISPTLLLAAPIDDFFHNFGEMTKENWKGSVKIHGISTTVFDYKAIHAEYKSASSSFSKALKALQKTDLSKLKKGNKQKAFWINVYNFAAMKLVAENYPIDSIRSRKISLLKYPWSKEIVKIGSSSYSLTQIEKDILLANYKDPRIVFAVSCAAVSCPDRTNKIFLPENLDKQMDDLIKNFFKNEQKGILLNKKNNELKLAWILEKDGHLFKLGKGLDVLDFIIKYLSTEDAAWIKKSRNSLKIKYFSHDWGLNDLALKDK